MPLHSELERSGSWATGSPHPAAGRYSEPQDGESKLLVLDLDETLVHACDQPLERPPEFEVCGYQVYCRPGLPIFLAFCRQNFKVAVWTSSSEAYADDIVAQVFGPQYPLEFVWARRRCTRVFDAETRTYEFIKNLDKLNRRGYRLERVIVIDDTPAKLARHYGNLVRVAPFEGDLTDRELRHLMPFLLQLNNVPNVRSVEKRGWRRTSSP